MLSPKVLKVVMMLMGFALPLLPLVTFCGGARSSTYQRQEVGVHVCEFSASLGGLRFGAGDASFVLWLADLKGRRTGENFANRRGGKRLLQRDSGVSCCFWEWVVLWPSGWSLEGLDVVDLGYVVTCDFILIFCCYRFSIVGFFFLNKKMILH